MKPHVLALAVVTSLALWALIAFAAYWAWKR